MKELPVFVFVILASIALIIPTHAQNVLEVTATADPKETCTGQTVQLDVEVVGGLGSYAYTWTSDPPGFSSTQRDPEANPMITTTYIVEAADGTNFGTGQVVVTVHPYPQVQIGNDTTICEGGSVMFDAGTGFASYLWQDGSSGQSFTATQTGLFWVEVSNEYGCADRDSAFLTVNLLPAKPAKPAGPSLIITSEISSSAYLTSTAADLIAFTWDLQPEEAGILEAFEDSARVHWDTLYSGAAWIKVMTENDCGSSLWSDSLLIEVQSTHGLDENLPDARLVVFPNPTHGRVVLNIYEADVMNAELCIFSLAGNVVYRKIGLNLGKGAKEEVNISHLPAGIYSLAIIDKKQLVLRTRIILF